MGADRRVRAPFSRAASFRASAQPLPAGRYRGAVTDLGRPEGLVFDLDGTLVDTVAARIAGWIEALGEAGIATTTAQVGSMIGMDGKRLTREVARRAGRAPSDDEVESIDRAAGAAFDRRNARPRPLPGLAETLAATDRCGARWLIATSSRAEQVRGSVAALGLAREPMIVDGSQVEHAKPAPDLLLLSAEQLGAAPAACWAVGDSTWDVRAAIAAGMTPIGVTAGSALSAEDLLAAGAAVVVPTLVELAQLLDETCPGDPGRAL